MKQIWVLVLIVQSFSIRAQIIDNPDKFSQLCKSFSNLQIFRGSDYLDENMNLYILDKPATSKNNNPKITFDHNSIKLNIWSKVYLFSENVQYWFEFTKITEIDNDIVLIEFRSFNAPGAKNNKPIVKGMVKFRYIEGDKFMILEENIIKE